METAAKQELVTASSAATPMDLLRIAIDKNADLDKLQKLVELQERWEANEARKAYVAAMNEFRADPPVIYKEKQVNYETSKGTTSYKHALLENAAELIGAALAKHGLSFRWDTEQLDGGQVRVTCVITHAKGHSERTGLQAGLDQSGGKNNIQALGSTVTYLERYTLFAATGIAAKGEDDDGAGAGTVEYIDEKQLADLKALLEETNSNVTKFCEHFKIESLDKLPVKVFKQAVALTEAKRKLAPKNNEEKK